MARLSSGGFTWGAFVIAAATTATLLDSSNVRMPTVASKSKLF